MAHEAQDSDAQELWRNFKRTGCERTREKLIVAHQNLVRFLASKFNGRGIPLEDLVQVGNIGLINAIDRYDPERGTKFSTYATPTIVGEIRRHFRDKGWGMKVPRRLQELNQLCRDVEEDLFAALNREPTIREIADKIGIGEEEAREALDISMYYNSASFEHQFTDSGSDRPLSLEEFVGENDHALDGIIEHDELRHAIAKLDEREQFIVAHRFFLDESQTLVANQLGISQMHVSRLQERAIKRLRIFLGAETDREFSQILLKASKTKTSGGDRKGTISITDLKRKYYSASRKKVKKVSEKSTIAIPLGLVPVAFWIFVAYGDGESGPMDLKVLSELIGIPHKQIYAKMAQTEKTGVVSRISDVVAGHKRGNGNITVSTTSKESESETGGTIFVRGNTYDLTKIADEYRSRPEAVEIIKRLTTIKTQSSSVKKVTATRPEPLSAQSPDQTPTVAGMLQQLAGAVRFLATVDGFSHDRLGEVLNPSDIETLKTWVEPIVPISASNSGEPTIPMIELLQNDPTLSHCLDAIRTLCNDGHQAITSLYEVASKRER